MKKKSDRPRCNHCKRPWHTHETFLSVNSNYTWIVDFGASDHMTGESSFFASYSPCAGNQKIKIADGSFSAIAGKGCVVISPTLILQNVLHVPNLSCNLLSVSKLVPDINCLANFFRSHCVLKDLYSGRTIGSAKESGGLYLLEEVCGSRQQLQSMSSCFESVFVSNNNKDIML